MATAPRPEPDQDQLATLRRAAASDPTSVRTFTPVPPEERPRRRRRTARVLLIDDRDRTLLFADTDPGEPGSGWWMTPGGGVEPGESDRDAAVRELGEETGHRADPEDLLGPVLVRHVRHGYSDVIIDQEDVYYVCWVPAFEVSDAGHTPEERITMSRHRWWSREELASTSDTVWPADLAVLWQDADGRRGRPAQPPQHDGPVEESTVPL